jgi:hypothetical protein
MILVCDAPGLQFLALVVPKLCGVYRWLLLDLGKLAADYRRFCGLVI